MAKKKSGSESKANPSQRRHLSRAEREALERQRLVVGSTVVAVLVVVILALGVLYSLIVEPSQAMASINGEEISRSEFYDRVTYERFRLYETVTNTREQALESMADPQTGAMFGQFFTQQLQQLQAAYFQIGGPVLEQVVEERVIRIETADRDITVSDDEVEEEIRREFARRESALIEVDVTATAEANADATATAELFTPTPTLEPSPTPTDTVATEPITPTMTPAATSTARPTLTPNILSDETYDDSYTQFLSDLGKYVDYGDAEYRQIVHDSLLREKLEELIGDEADINSLEDQVHAAHILVETQAEAEQAIERLNGGEAFADLAAELSTDTSNAEDGGDLGWFGSGQMVPAFEAAAFELTEVGEISEPVETQFGWHVITLLEEPEQRDKAEATLEQERQEAFRTFLLEAKERAGVERYWDTDDLPSDPFANEVREPLPTALPVPTTPPVEISTPVPAEEEPADE